MTENGIAAENGASPGLVDGSAGRIVEAFADGFTMLGSSIETAGGLVAAAGSTVDQAAQGLSRGAFLIGGVVGSAARLVEGVSGALGLTLVTAGGLVGSVGSLVNDATRIAGRGLTSAGDTIRSRGPNGVRRAHTTGKSHSRKGTRTRTAARTAVAKS